MSIEYALFIYFLLILFYIITFFLYIKNTHITYKNTNRKSENLEMYKIILLHMNNIYVDTITVEGNT